jgi:hypothetical protein
MSSSTRSFLFSRTNVGSAVIFPSNVALCLFLKIRQIKDRPCVGVKVVSQDEAGTQTMKIGVGWLTFLSREKRGSSFAARNTGKPSDYCDRNILNIAAWQSTNGPMIRVTPRHVKSWGNI